MVCLLLLAYLVLGSIEWTVSFVYFLVSCSFPGLANTFYFPLTFPALKNDENCFLPSVNQGKPNTDYSTPWHGTTSSIVKNTWRRSQ